MGKLKLTRQGIKGEESVDSEEKAINRRHGLKVGEGEDEKSLGMCHMCGEADDKESDFVLAWHNRK